MFNAGDRAYFVFHGDWVNGSYKGYFCLHPKYFPFMPIEILLKNFSATGPYQVRLLNLQNWSLYEGCIEKEFSLERFIIAQLNWNKRVTAYQFKQILSTLGR